MKKAFFVFLLLPFLLAACSLASDITPPPGYKPPAAPTAAPASYPLVPPDPAQGAALYTDNCAPCHGSSGMGDGPQAANLANPVAAIGSPDLARQAKPVAWYNIVTNGEMNLFMPPFSGSLTDRQRWDVVAYVFTLSAPSQAVQEGQGIYTGQCASCHGASGRGDGPQAASPAAKVPDWSDSSRLAQFSAQDLYDATSKGIAPGMPAFSGQLSAEQTWAVASYVRSLSFVSGSSGAIASAATQSATDTTPVQAVTAQTTPAAPAATDQSSTTAPAAITTAVTPAPTTAASNATPTPVGTVVTGKVNINGKVTFNAGGSLPSGLSVSLLGYDNMTQVSTATAPINADGTFAFTGVDIVAGRVWLAQVEYNKVAFTSQPLHDTDIKAGQDATMNVTITASSTDASVLKAQRLHVFFDFSTAGSLQVAELFIVQNPTDKAVVPVSATNPSLTFELPKDATNLQFQDGTLGDGRYVQTANGFGVTDSITPQGTAQVLFAYEVPYTNNKASLSVPITMPVDSAVVLAPASGVNIGGSQVVAAGTQNVQGSGTFALYTADNLAKGSTLDLTVSGMPSTQTGAAAGTTSSNGGNGLLFLVIGLAVFGVVLIGGGFWLVRQRRAAAVADEGEVETLAPAIGETPESILDAIVALDDLYQAGELPEEAYKERRAELKDRLKHLRG